MKLYFLVESWGKPWNEGYKNLAKYIHDLVEETFNVDVIEARKRPKLWYERIPRNSILWIFNYPEDISSIINLVRLKKQLGSLALKTVAKKEIDVNLKERIKTNTIRSILWDLIITTTSELKYELKKYFKKIVYLPPPIPTNHFKPLDREYSRKILGLPMEAICIGYAGTLNIYRKFELLIDALRDISRSSSVILVLALSSGQASFKNAIRHLYGLQISVKYVRSISDIRILYSALDLLVYPVERMGAIEPPLTILEAMSSGCVVAALKNVITQSIIEHEKDGFLFDNSYELRLLIKKLIRGDINRELISYNAREKISALYSYNVLKSIYINFLEKLTRDL